MVKRCVKNVQILCKFYIIDFMKGTNIALEKITTKLLNSYCNDLFTLTIVLM